MATVTAVEELDYAEQEMNKLGAYSKYGLQLYGIYRMDNGSTNVIVYDSSGTEEQCKQAILHFFKYVDSVQHNGDKYVFECVDAMFDLEYTPPRQYAPMPEGYLASTKKSAVKKGGDLTEQDYFDQLHDLLAKENNGMSLATLHLTPSGEWEAQVYDDFPQDQTEQALKRHFKYVEFIEHNMNRWVFLCMDETYSMSKSAGIQKASIATELAVIDFDDNWTAVVRDQQYEKHLKYTVKPNVPEGCECQSTDNIFTIKYDEATRTWLVLNDRGDVLDKATQLNDAMEMADAFIREVIGIIINSDLNYKRQLDEQNKRVQYFPPYRASAKKSFSEMVKSIRTKNNGIQKEDKPEIIGQFISELQNNGYGITDVGWEGDGETYTILTQYRGKTVKFMFSMRHSVVLVSVMGSEWELDGVPFKGVSASEIMRGCQEVVNTIFTEEGWM